MKEFLEKCWQLVSIIETPILVVRVFDIPYAFLTKDFKVKQPYAPWNEVIGQDITSMVTEISISALAEGNNNYLLKAQSLPELSFKFGHDDYIVMNYKRKNVY